MTRLRALSLACTLASVCTVVRATVSVEQWDFIELTFAGEPAGNPDTAVELSAQFEHGERSRMVRGFDDGRGGFKIRFMPDEPGTWSYRTCSNLPALDRKTGTLLCVPAAPGNRGPIQVARTYHFEYADGTPYLPVGTTCYAWIHQPPVLQARTLETLRTSPFNKLRMCVLPKFFAYNRTEPPHHPYLRNASGEFDFSRFNPEFFEAIETNLKRLRDLDIEADLILFHPYDKGQWGFDRMGREANHRYLRHVVARFAAFRNVWWSLANEYDLVESISIEAWDSLFRTLQAEDPYDHLRSIHNGHLDAFYDHHRPWITHVSVQHPDMKDALAWRKYGKPVINDECEYEGDIWQPWGNITARELVNRFWLGYGYGIYVGHGETYEHDSGVLWWSHGGELRGESVARIAFLKAIMLETSPQGITVADPDHWLWTRFSGGSFDGGWIYYFAEHQPARWNLGIADEGRQYTVDLIDTWNMTVERLEGRFRKGDMIPMPGKPWMALRIRESG